MDVTVRQLGLVPFEDCWKIQKEAQANLVSGTGENLLLLCQHPPIVTLGRSTKEEHIGNSREFLAAAGIPVFDIERGGSITYHGPEQLIVYPILNLTFWKRDVHWYMRQLEEVIIRTLRDFELVGTRIEGRTGVWVDDGQKASKIAFIGVRISRWCTMHGFSINLSRCAERFESFNPCGLGAIDITSIEEMRKSNVSVESVENSVLDAFEAVFRIDPSPDSATLMRPVVRN